MTLVAIYLVGVVFGTGIVLSGMVNPAKVLNFFDIAGAFDPSLALVMGGALVTTHLGYRRVLARTAPLFADGFALPTARSIDGRLVGGAAMFGIGWGIAGFCPGGALPALGTGQVDAFVFTAALIAGIILARRLAARR